MTVMNRESMLSELRKRFNDSLNYTADDPTTPIDPITYRTPEGDSCLHIAAMRNDIIATNLLLDLGMDVNVRGDMGYTPLHYAWKNDAQAVYDTLIARGAATDIRNEFGEMSGR